MKIQAQETKKNGSQEFDLGNSMNYSNTNNLCVNTIKERFPKAV